MLLKVKKGMLFAQNISKRQIIMGQWDDFLKELVVIEVKYWKHLRGTKLSDHYVLREDSELRFGFKANSDLSREIKDACFEVFDKYRSQKRFA